MAQSAITIHTKQDIIDYVNGQKNTKRTALVHYSVQPLVVSMRISSAGN